MKSGIATVLGTVALGFLKRKLGSSIRLSKKRVSVLESENRFLISYDGNPFQENITINSSVPEINSIRLQFIFSDDGQTAHDLEIIFNKLYTNNQIFQIIQDNAYKIMMEAWDAFKTIYDNYGENAGWSYLYTSNALQYDIDKRYVLEEDLLDPLLHNLLFFNDSVVTNQEIVINADTGEEYNPYSASSKLRKR